MAEQSIVEMKKWAQIVAQAWADDNLKQRLLQNPASVLQEHGIQVPDGREVRVVEGSDWIPSTGEITYLTLPAKPLADVTELNPAEMAGVAAGFSTSRITASCVNEFDFPPLFLQGIRA